VPVHEQIFGPRAAPLRSEIAERPVLQHAANPVDKVVGEAVLLLHNVLEQIGRRR